MDVFGFGRHKHLLVFINAIVIPKTDKTCASTELEWKSYGFFAGMYIYGHGSWLVASNVALRIRNTTRTHLEAKRKPSGQQLMTPPPARVILSLVDGSEITRSVQTRARLVRLLGKEVQSAAATSVDFVPYQFQTEFN